MDIIEFLCRLPTIQGIMSTPVGWGLTYCFTDVGFGSVSHQLLMEPLLKFFLGGMFFVPYAMTLTFALQAMRAFFIGMGFSLILSKVQRGF